jgi:hypothetical protein
LDDTTIFDFGTVDGKKFLDKLNEALSRARAQYPYGSRLYTMAEAQMQLIDVFTGYTDITDLDLTAEDKEAINEQWQEAGGN